jgi:hypothetical protein
MSPNHIYTYKQDTYVYTIIPILNFVTPINFEGIFSHFTPDLVNYMLCSTITCCIIRLLSFVNTLFFLHPIILSLNLLSNGFVR